MFILSLLADQQSAFALIVDFLLEFRILTFHLQNTEKYFLA